MKQNLVSFSFSDDEFAAIKQKVGELQVEVDKFAVDLHVGDMRELKTLGDRSFAFTEHAFLIATQQKDMIPGFVTYDEFNKDFTLFKQTKELINLLELILERVKDTYYAAGADSFSAARKIYNTVQYAVKNNIAGADVAYEALKKRFARITEKKTEPGNETDSQDNKDTATDKKDPAANLLNTDDK